MATLEEVDQLLSNWKQAKFREYDINFEDAVGALFDGTSRIELRPVGDGRAPLVTKWSVSVYL